MAGGLDMTGAGEFGEEAPLNQVNDTGEHGDTSAKEIARINAEFAIRQERIQAQQAQQQAQQPQQPPQQQGAAPGQQPQAAPSVGGADGQPAAPAQAQQPQQPQQQPQQPQQPQRQNPMMDAQRQLIEAQKQHQQLLQQQMQQAQQPNQLDAWTRGFLENKGKGGFGGLLGGLMGMKDAKSQQLAKQMDVSKMRMEIAMKQAQAEGDLHKMDKIAAAEEAADQVFTIGEDGTPQWNQQAANVVLKNNPELAKQMRGAFEHAESQHEQQQLQQVLPNVIKNGVVDQGALQSAIASSKNPAKMQAELFKAIKSGREAGLIGVAQDPQSIAEEAASYKSPGAGGALQRAAGRLARGEITHADFQKVKTDIDKREQTFLDKQAADEKRLAEARERQQLSFQNREDMIRLAHSLKPDKTDTITSEHQGKNLTFGSNMADANDSMKEYERRGVRINTQQALMNALARDAKGNITGLKQQAASGLDPVVHQYLQEANKFVVAKLRKESGAAINADEYVREMAAAIPIGQRGSVESASLYRQSNADRTMAQTGLSKEAQERYSGRTKEHQDTIRKNVGLVFGDKQQPQALPKAGETISVGGVKITAIN